VVREPVLTTIHSQPDEFTALIEEARQGGAEALGQLLTRYRNYVIFLARSQLHHHLQAKADPSDLAQEVNLAAHQGIAQFQGRSPEEFAAWLRGILTHVLAMHVRRYMGTKKRDPRLEQALDQRLADASGFLQSGLAGDVTSPSQRCVRNEAFLQLAEALEQLPADYRQVIVLRHIDALPFAEIARLMERSVDSVEKLWVRALAKLRMRIA
jgi:RNA polymerase sigma-70 factor, ECF subfamily